MVKEKNKQGYKKTYDDKILTKEKLERLSKKVGKK